MITLNCRSFPMEINPYLPVPPQQPKKPSSDAKKDSSLEDMISTAKEALSGDLKQQRKNLSKIMQEAEKALQANPENQDDIIAQANETINAEVDGFFSKLNPSSQQQLQGIGGSSTSDIIDAMKQEMQQTYQPNSLIGATSGAGTASNTSAIEQAIQQKYGPQASIQNIGSFDPELLALIQAFEKAPSALAADAIFQQIQLALGGTPSAAPTPPQSQINSLIEQFISQAGFSGSVMVVQNGIPIFDQGYGEASSGQPNGPNTTFRWDSVGKIVTATAITQLNERGALNLDNPITNYLPSEYSDPQKYPSFVGVTVRSLLTMTSGLADLPPTPPSNWNSPPTLSDIASYVGTTPRSGQGEWSYSNTSFNLLAMIIGHVSNPQADPGAAYSSFIQQNIFNPAGMSTASAPWTVSGDQPDAECHVFDQNGNPQEIGTDQYPDYTSLRIGAGNINGSSWDFEKFYSALNEGKLITTTDWQQIQNQANPTLFNGWDPGPHMVNGVPCIAKGGAQDGEQSFFLQIPPGSNTMIFITANIAPKGNSPLSGVISDNPQGHIQYLAGEIANLLFPPPPS